MIITFQLKAYLLMIVMWNYGFYTVGNHYLDKIKNNHRVRCSFSNQAVGK
jgi:hypothetical protein